MLKLKDVLSRHDFEYCFCENRLFDRVLEDGEVKIKATIPVSGEDECELSYYWYYAGDKEFADKVTQAFEHKDFEAFLEMHEYDIENHCYQLLPPVVSLSCKDKCLGWLDMNYYTFDNLDFQEYEWG